jgi:integrase
VKVHGLQWERPRYYAPSKFPRIPLESQINLIISKSSLKLSTAISISKDTGLRPIEVCRLRLRDIDLRKGAVYPETAKHGSPRILKLKKNTLNLLNKYLTSRHIEINDKLFGYWNTAKYGENFRKARNKIAEKMGDESIKTIRLYDLRHYFATMLYKEMNDIMFVAQQLGHRNIRNTMKYTQLLQFDRDDAYVCKVSQSVEQDKEFIENGFEYVTDRDGLKIFRKRK